MYSLGIPFIFLGIPYSPSHWGSHRCWYMFGKLSYFKRASRSLAKTGFSHSCLDCAGVRFGDISGKLGSHMWVRILYWFGSRFGVSFGSVLGSFWSTFGPCGHPLGLLWAASGCFGWFLQYSSVLLSASGHYGVPFCAFVSPLGAFGVISGHFRRFFMVLCSCSSGIPWIFPRYSWGTPLIFLRYALSISGIPWVFLRYSSGIPHIFVSYSQTFIKYPLRYSFGFP